MKITTFNPSIITKEAAPIIKLFEDLGLHFVETEIHRQTAMENSHNKAENVDVEFSSHRMKNEGGFHVDVVEVPSIPKTYMGIRINVDNYEEAYDFFISRGFRESKGFAPSTTKSSKYAFLISPSGFLIDVCEHIKKK